MKRTMSLALAILLSAVSALAADVSGQWSGTMTDDRSSDSLLLTLQQDGTKLTGTGGPNEAQRRPLEKGMVQGDVVTFQVSAGAGVLVFDLRIKGDEITGMVEMKRDGQTVRSARVSLKRQLPAA